MSEEPTLLSYARFHGLAINHLNEPFQWPQPLLREQIQDESKFPDLNQVCKQDSTCDDVEGLMSRMSQDLAHTALKEDKLHLSRRAAGFLSEVLKPSSWTVWNVRWRDWETDSQGTSQRDSPDHCIDNVDSRMKLACRLKMELPLLVGDHAKDMIRFRRKPCMNDMLAIIQIDEDISQAMEADMEEWFEKIQVVSRQWDEEARNEKIRVTKETLARLMDTIRVDSSGTAQALRDFFKCELSYKKDDRLEPLTPGLMPEDMIDLMNDEELEADLDLKVWPLNTPGPELPLTSKPADLESPLLKEAVGKMFEEDKFTIEDQLVEAQGKMERNLREVESEPKWSFQDHRFEREEGTAKYVYPKPQDKHFLRDHMELDDLLSLPTSGVETFVEDVDSENADQGLDELFNLLPNPEEEKLTGVRREQSVEDYLQKDDLWLVAHMEKYFEQAEESFRSDLQHEKIDDPTLLARLDLPILKHIHASRREKQTPRQKMSFVDRSLMDVHLTLINIDHEEQVRMNWVPFPLSATELDLQEKCEDQSGYLGRALKPPSNIIKSRELLWHPDRPKVLGEHSDNSDVEEDLSIESEEPNPAKVEHMEQPEILKNEQKGFKTSSEVTENKLAKPNWQELASTNLNTKFSTSALLSNFLETRGNKFKKPKQIDGHFGGGGDNLDPIVATQDDIVKSTKAEHDDKVMVPQTPLFSPHRLLSMSQVTMSAATIQPLATPRAIIVSNDLLQSQRSLITFLESHTHSDESEVDSNDQMLTIVYRDMNTSEYHDKSHRASPDIILNPQSCCILTGLHALTQRLLPGQGASSLSGLSPVHDRVLSLAEDYETLWVMVCHSSSGAVSASDSTTWLNWVAFCAGSYQDCAVRSILVSLDVNLAGGNDLAIHPHPFLTQCTPPHPLHARVWTLIQQHAFETSPNPHFNRPVSLIHEQTVWSVFLRRCGLNEFAAQVVLASLDDRGECVGRDAAGHLVQNPRQEAGAGGWGLRRFVRMGFEQRLRMFGAILGRRAVLRVGEALERASGLAI